MHMCVNNLLRVALDSGETGIRTRDLLIASPASQPLGHRASLWMKEPHNNSPTADPQAAPQGIESSACAMEDSDEDFSTSGLSPGITKRGALLVMPYDKEKARRLSKPSVSISSPDRCATRLDNICHTTHILHLTIRLNEIILYSIPNGIIHTLTKKIIQDQPWLSGWGDQLAPSKPRFNSHWYLCELLVVAARASDQNCSLYQ